MRLGATLRSSSVAQMPQWVLVAATAAVLAAAPVVVRMQTNPFPGAREGTYETTGVPLYREFVTAGGH